MAISLLILLSLTACSSLPSVEPAATVSLRSDFPSFLSLQVDVDGDPELKPGRMAMGGLEASAACDAFFFICALVTVPVAAATGAAITATETLPDEQAHELNRVTSRAMAGVDRNMELREALQAAAAEHDIVLKNKQADVLLDVNVTEFWWDVGLGNRAAMMIRVQVTGSANGKTGERDFKFIGKRAKTAEWTADSGALIREEFSSLMAEASQKFWLEVLDLRN